MKSKKVLAAALAAALSLQSMLASAEEFPAADDTAGAVTEDIPADTADDVDEPAEAPEDVDEPADAPEDVDEPADAPEDVDEPAEAPEDVDEPAEAPEDVDEPADAPEDVDEPADAPEDVDEPEEAPEDAGEPEDADADGEEEEETQADAEEEGGSDWIVSGDFIFSASDETGTSTLSAYLGTDPSIIVPSGVTYGGKEYPLGAIGDYAFNKVLNGNILKPNNKENTTLVSVTIPEGVKAFGTGAFKGCSKLTYVDIPTTLTAISDNAFEKCTSLQTAPLSNSIAVIGNSAFLGCTSLTDVTFYYSITTIGKNAFEKCSSLETVDMSINSVVGIGDNAFLDCTGLKNVTLSSRMRAINPGAFMNCTSLESIIIPNDVLTIGAANGKGAFYGCTSLTNVTMSKNVTLIGTDTFRGCSNLVGFTLPSTLTEVGNYAFSGCSSFDGKLPAYISKIGNYAFQSCELLQTGSPSPALCFDSADLDIGTNAFEFCRSIATVKFRNTGTVSIKKSAFASCTALSSLAFNSKAKSINIGEEAFKGDAAITVLKLPTSITNIGASAFCGIGITEIVLPSSLKSLSTGVFAQCSKLAKVTIPESITTIAGSGTPTGTLNAGKTNVGKGAFSDCVSIKSIKLHNKLTSIGACAFSGCTGLEAIVIPDSVKTIGNYAFYDCRGAKTINLGKGVNTINLAAFEHCLGVTELNIPSSVKMIYTAAFGAMTELKKVTMNSNIVSEKKDIGFYENVFQTDTETCLCSHYNGQQVTPNTEKKLEEIVFASGVTEIADKAFQNCGLKRILFAKSVKSIGAFAFFHCTELEYCSTIPRNVTTIKNNAFNGCTNLQAIVIPDSVTSIEENVFAGIEGLTIFGSTGSKAHIYAKRGNDSGEIKFVPIYQELSGLKATPSAAGESVALKWNNIEPKVSGYALSDIVFEIYRSADGAEPVLAGTAKPASASAATVSFTDKNVDEGANYTYSVEAHYKFTLKDGVSTFEVITASAEAKATVPKIAVKARNIKASVGDKQAVLSWTAAEGAKKYKVFTYLNSKYSAVGETTSTSYVVTGLVNDTKYGFLVLAYDGKAWNKYSTKDVIYATPSAAKVPLPVIHRASPGKTQISLAWTPINGATKYRVFSYYSNKFYNLGDTTKTSIMIDGKIDGPDGKVAISAGRKCGFLVLASNGKTWSKYTVDDVVYVTPTNTDFASPVITNISAGNGQLAVSWTPVNGAKKYRVFKYVDGKFTKIEDTESTSTIINGLTNGKVAGVLVLSSDDKTWSKYTVADVVYATPQASAVAQPALKAYGSKDTVTLSWKGVAGAKKYRVFQYVNGKYVSLGDTTRQNYTVSGLATKTEYTFLVLAYNGKTWSKYTKGDGVVVKL